jgi:hypothetical protein
MKIFAELSRSSGGATFTRLIGLNDDGSECEEVTATLLSFVEELHPNEDDFERVIREVEAGAHSLQNPEVPDFYVNEICVWLRPPRAGSGELVISNEYVPAVSSTEGGVPQRFSMVQFSRALEFWNEFKKRVSEDGAEYWIGRRLEIEI